MTSTPIPEKKEEMDKAKKDKNKPKPTVNTMIDSIHDYMKGLDERIAKRLEDEKNKNK